MKNNLIFQSLPQTPASGAGGKASVSTGSNAGMVNGAGVDHENTRDGAGIDTELVSIQSIIRYICSIILCIYNLLN